jgi:hypothetical protein
MKIDENNHLHVSLNYERNQIWEMESIDICIENKGLALSYYGVANVLLEYTGLKQGIKEIYNKLKYEY